MNNNLKQLAVVIVVLVVMLISGFLLLRYFYPSSATISPEVVSPSIDEDEEIGDINFGSSLSYKSNLTQEIILNSKYKLNNQTEATFINGVFKAESPTGEINSKISLYDFGDINGDGSGDALAVTESSYGGENILELHVVLNNKGESKSFASVPAIDSGFKINKYRNVSIVDRKIILEMDLLSVADASVVRSIATYVFENNSLSIDLRKPVWKKYRSSEFGFELSYPEGTPLQVRPIIEDGKDIAGTIRASVAIPFTTSYNTWTSKTFTVYADNEACPFRNDSEIVTRNEVSWHVYDPSNKATSNPTQSRRIREYMTYHKKHCFTILMALEGPGPLSEDFPKEADAQSPDNLENFFKLELVSLEQMLDTFKFL